MQSGAKSFELRRNQRGELIYEAASCEYLALANRLVWEVTFRRSSLLTSCGVSGRCTVGT